MANPQIMLRSWKPRRRPVLEAAIGKTWTDRPPLEAANIASLREQSRRLGSGGTLSAAWSS